jgi:hypothetical protein
VSEDPLETARRIGERKRAKRNGKAASKSKPAPSQPAGEYPPENPGDAYEGPDYMTDPPPAIPPDAREPPPLLIARPASAYKATPVDWLWAGRIPCGAVTIFDGDPGLGKSTITLDLAARVSRGYAMPPNAPERVIEPASVVILSAEDDPARTIRPRLEAAGADLDRVLIVEGVAVGDGDRLPILPYDLVALEDFVRRHCARLVIVDPLMAFLGEGVESHKDQSVRGALSLFGKLAERTQSGLLVVRHLNKLTGGSAIYRGGGSIGIIGAARSGLLLAKHPDNPSSRVLASVKSNLGPPPRSIVVSLVAAGPVAVAAWGEEIDMSADDLLGAPSAARRTKVDECADAIVEIVTAAGGRMRSVDLDTALEARGLRERTRKAARKVAGIRATKNSMDGEWWAELPTPTE